MPELPVPVPGPRPLEEECQTGGTEQDATLEELCKPLYCKLCNVTLNSAQQAQAHYQVVNLNQLAPALLLTPFVARHVTVVKSEVIIMHQECEVQL